MFQKIENYLILKNSENFEEHIAKIIELEKESRKIKLQLIDENKNIYVMNYSSLDSEKIELIVKKLKQCI